MKGGKTQKILFPVILASASDLQLVYNYTCIHMHRHTDTHVCVRTGLLRRVTSRSP